LSNYRTFVKNNLIILSGHLLIYAQGVILMPIIIKTIGVKVYGGYSILITSVGFLMAIASFGVGFRRSRYLPSAKDAEERRTLFYPQFYINFASLMLLSLGLILSYPIMDRLFFKGDLHFSIWLVVPYYCFYLLYGQTTSYFRYTHRISVFNYSTLSYACLNIIMILLLIFLGYKLTINVLFIIQIISSFLVALPLTIKMIQEIGLRFALPDMKDLFDDIKLGFPLVLAYFFDFILNSSDKYVITAYISITAVGYYNAAYALGSLIILIPTISGVVLPPLISKAIDTGNEVEARTMINYTVKGFLLVGIPFVVGCAVMSKPILILITNAEVANNAFLVTPMVSLGTIFYGLFIILANVLFVRLKTAIIFKINIFAAIFNIGLNLIIIYYIRNILVAAITTCLSYFISFVIMNYVITNDWFIDYDLKSIMKSIVASLCMGIILHYLSSMFGTGPIQISYVLGEVIVGIIIYCLAILLLRTFSSKELIYLKKLVTNQNYAAENGG